MLEQSYVRVVKTTYSRVVKHTPNVLKEIIKIEHPPSSK
jgi:hypothetical protein